MLDCPHQGRCGGCPWGGQRPSAQRAAKVAALASAWSAADLPPLPALTLRPLPYGAPARDRADLRLLDRGATIGLLGEGGALVDIDACALMSPALAPLYARLRADPPPLPRASLRLRVSPAGRLGLWIDLANLDCLALLQEGAWLRRWTEARVVVELGQKRKRALPLGEEADGFKLSEPELRPWTESWLLADPRQGASSPVRAAPIYQAVGSFSQPGHAANRALHALVGDLLPEGPLGRVIEWGAGAGNFTLPLAQRSKSVVAIESEPLSRAGLDRSLHEAGLQAKVTVRDKADSLDADLLFVDPPRSGIGPLLPLLAATEAPPATLFYLACAGEALVRDAVTLAARGYRPVAAGGLDQFPHSAHAEWAVTFRRG